MKLHLVVFLSKISLKSEISDEKLPVAAAGLQRRVINFLKRYFIYRLTGVTLWPFLVIYIKHYLNNLYLTHLCWYFFHSRNFLQKCTYLLRKNMGCKVVQAGIMGLYGAGSLIKLNFAELLDDKRPNAGLCQPYTSDKICMIHSARWGR